MRTSVLLVTFISALVVASAIDTNARTDAAAGPCGDYGLGGVIVKSRCCCGWGALKVFLRACAADQGQTPANLNPGVCCGFGGQDVLTFWRVLRRSPIFTIQLCLCVLGVPLDHS